MLQRHNRLKDLAAIFTLIVLLLTAIITPLYLKNRNQDTRGSASALGRNIYAVGDSITFGHRDCVNGFDCKLEPDTYLSNFANRTLEANKGRGKNNVQYHNLAYSGTAVQGSLSNASFLNAYKNNTVNAPQNQNSIQQPNQLLNKREGGQTRAAQGEFSNIKNSTFIMAYGRNDVSKKTSVEAFKASYEELLKRVDSSNERIMLTIPPMSYEGWKRYSPTSTPVTNYPYAIEIPEYPTELDSFFSSQIWELAAKYGTKIVPVHEHLILNPQEQQNYFSSDQIHPSKAGHQIISNLLINNTSSVYSQKVSDIVPVNKVFTVNSSSKKKIYGQVVNYNQGKFLASTPIMINPGETYSLENIGTETFIYTTEKVNIKRVSDSAQTSITLRQQTYLLNDRIAVTVQGLQSIDASTIQFYFGPKSPSNYCSFSPVPWKPMQGRFYGNTFLSDQSVKNLIGNPGDYIVMMNYSSDGKIVTGNPAGNCKLNNVVSKPGLYNTLKVTQ